MAVSLDHLSGGRFDLGIGWGSVPDELDRFGVHPEPPAVRSARLAETLEVLQRLFTGEPVDHDGAFFTLRSAQQRPVPVNGAIPVLIGGGGPKLTMPLVARFADWWNCPSYAVDNLAELRPLAGTARVSTQHPVGLAASTAVREEVAELAQRRFRGWGGLLVGTPDEIVDAMISEVHQGVERFYVPFTDFATTDTIELFAREVIPAVRAAA
jgi:alkanesulfonate monooxygenase SsuD/methylene tetrahydromethanopterin reductase-like flavin-dependent oxidoreductase (luciferase family)